MYILPTRSIFKVSGSDAIVFLNRILTCRVDNIELGTCRFGALLTPQGKILTDLFLFKAEDSFILDLPTSEAGSIVKRLILLKLRANVSFEPMPDAVAVTSMNESEQHPNTLFQAADPRTRDGVVRGIAHSNREQLDDTPDKTISIRIEFGLPECGQDYAAVSLFPADINMDLTSGVDFKKGCFVGQEVVSRMKRKTEVRKRTLKVSGPEGVSQGDTLMAGQSTLGDVLCWSGTNGLALVRLDRLTNAEATGTSTTINGETAKADLSVLESYAV